MHVPQLLALLPLVTAVPFAPASAVTHGKVAVSYTSVPSSGGAVVAYACAGVGLGVRTDFSCSVATVASPPPVPTSTWHGVVQVSGPSYTVSVSMSVRVLDLSTAYRCAKSVVVSTAGPVSGVLECTA